MFPLPSLSFPVTECEQGRFGVGCTQSCDCEGDTPCDPMTGRCLCPPGKMGTRCDTNCPVNRYGPDCSESCECRNGAWCDPRNGRCTCLQGWIGPT
ncbi:unnamed protein product, partial [Coregonus sp. 'balchen']